MSVQLSLDEFICQGARGAPTQEHLKCNSKLGALLGPFGFVLVLSMKLYVMQILVIWGISSSPQFRAAVL